MLDYESRNCLTRYELLYEIKYLITAQSTACFILRVVRSALIIKIMETFDLSFSKFIGKRVTLSDDGEYYCGDYISGRFYSGKFGGSFYKPDGIYFKVNDTMIKMDVVTKITFSE